MRFSAIRDKQDGGGKAAFVKLADGESIKGVFRGDPVHFKQHFVNNTGALCPGLATCEHCKAGLKPAFRFRLNFVTNENGAYVAKIFEQGWIVYESLGSLHEEYDLQKTVVKITRKGEKQNTSYTIIPLPNGLTDEQAAKIAAVPLQRLEKKAPDSQSAVNQPSGRQGKTFDEAEAPEDVFGPPPTDEETPFE